MRSVHEPKRHGQAGSMSVHTHGAVLGPASASRGDQKEESSLPLCIAIGQAAGNVHTQDRLPTGLLLPKETLAKACFPSHLFHTCTTCTHCRRPLLPTGHQSTALYPAPAFAAGIAHSSRVSASDPLRELNPVRVYGDHLLTQCALSQHLPPHNTTTQEATKQHHEAHPHAAGPAAGCLSLPCPRRHPRARRLPRRDHRD